MAQTNADSVQEGRSTIWPRNPPPSRLCVCVCVCTSSRLIRVQLQLYSTLLSLFDRLGGPESLSQPTCLPRPCRDDNLRCFVIISGFKCVCVCVSGGWQISSANTYLLSYFGLQLNPKVHRNVIWILNSASALTWTRHELSRTCLEAAAAYLPHCVLTRSTAKTTSEQRWCCKIENVFLIKLLLIETGWWPAYQRH